MKVGERFRVLSAEAVAPFGSTESRPANLVHQLPDNRNTGSNPIRVAILFRLARALALALFLWREEVSFAHAIRESTSKGKCMIKD